MKVDRHEIGMLTQRLYVTGLVSISRFFKLLSVMNFVSVSQIQVYFACAHLAYCLNSVLNVIVLVCTFNQEKVL